MDILNTKIKSILTEKNTKILPENIKAGVNILGILGIYEGEGGSDYNVKIKKYTNTDHQIMSNVVEIGEIDISECTIMTYGFYSMRSLVTFPYMDFSHVVDASYLFARDSSLVNIPELNFQSVTGTYNYNMFQNCSSLSNESLNNILKTCTTMTQVTNKNLQYMGITSAQATTCQSLSNWNAFVSAGWTTGY